MDIQKENLYLSLAKREGWGIEKRTVGSRQVYRVIVEGRSFALAHPYQIHLALYRDATDAGVKYEHFKAVHDYLWPEMRLTWNYWDERRFRAHCEGYSQIVLAGGAATGKAQPLWALVHTPSGFKNMGSLRVGDLVSCPDGSVSPITAVHPQGRRPCYKVSFSDGTSTVCDEDHLWTVRPRKHPHRIRTLPAKQLLSDKSNGGYRLPSYLPAPGISQALPVHPYALGVILGNGSLSSRVGSPSVTFGFKHPDVYEKFKETWEGRLTEYNVNRTDCRQVGLPGSAGLFKDLGLWGHKSVEKFIPIQYLNAGPEDRWELLRGLIDTDGTVGRAHDISFSTSSPMLAHDFLLLARSLGFVCSSSTKKPFFTASTGEKKQGSDSYTISLSGSLMTGLCKLKQARVGDAGRHRVTRSIESIEFYGYEECQCITIAHPDGLYFTNDFIVTHNSSSCARIAIIFWLSDPKRNACVIASTTLDSLESRIWGYVVKYLAAAALPVAAKVLNAKPPKVMHPKRTDKIHGMFAVAVKQGESKNTISTLIGRHPDRKLMIMLDEATDMPTAIIEALPNLEKGVEHMQLWAIGNSASKNDLHGSLATPRVGWKNINPERDFMWPTTHPNGVCLYFHPADSPAIHETDPGRKAALSLFLITEAGLDKSKKTYGEGSDAYYRFVLGFWRMSGSDEVLLSDVFLHEHRVREKAEWSGFYPLRIVAGLDPEFQVGGTGCVLRLAILGHTVDGLMCLDYRQEELLHKIDLRVGVPESGELQLANGVLKVLRSYGCPLENVLFDITGPGRAIGEVVLLVEQRTNPNSKGPLRMSSVSTKGSSKLEANEAGIYTMVPVDLWYTFRELIANNQIRGLDDRAIKQLHTRLIKTVNNKSVLETKREYKTRMAAVEPILAHSPDEADSAILAAHAAIIRYGLRAGQHIDMPQQRMTMADEKMRAFLANGGVFRSEDAAAQVARSVERPPLLANFSSDIEELPRCRLVPEE